MNSICRKILIIVLASVALIATGSVTASGVPSAASGAYYGTGQQAGWMCQFVFSYADSNHRIITTRCIDPLGIHRQGSSNALATCVHSGIRTYPGVLGFQNDFNVVMQFADFLPADIACPGGRLAIITNGATSNWCRVAVIPAFPYTCSGMKQDN